MPEPSSAATPDPRSSDPDVPDTLDIISDLLSDLDAVEVLSLIVKLSQSPQLVEAVGGNDAE